MLGEFVADKDGYGSVVPSHREDAVAMTMLTLLLVSQHLYRLEVVDDAGGQPWTILVIHLHKHLVTSIHLSNH